MALTRREVLQAAAAVVGLSPDGPRVAWAQPRRFRIGACDWSLGMRGRTALVRYAVEHDLIRSP